MEPRTTLLALAAVALVGCGGGQKAPDAPAGAGSSCADFGLTEPEVQSECQAVEAECPGQVQMLETDPPQFACGSGTDAPAPPSADDSVSPDTGDGFGGAASDTCEGYRLGDDCIHEDNFAECQKMAAQCPGEVQVLESCPLQFTCP